MSELQSKKMKEKWNDSSYREMMLSKNNQLKKGHKSANGMLGKKHTTESKELMRESHIGAEFHFKVGEVSRSNGTKIKIGIATKKRWEIPEYKEKLREKFKSKVWTSEHRKKIASSNGLKPTKPELIINDILSKSFSNWIYTGDGKIWIGDKNPDFMNNDNQIIEVFGSYWHKPEDEQERINHFANYGYKALIIWDYELKNLENVENKIREVL